MATKIEKKQNELAREVSCSIKLMAKQGEGLKQYYRVYFRSFYTREVVDAKNYRGASRVARPQCKCIKREAIVGPAVDKDVAHEDVGLKTAVLIPKEIPVIRKNNPVLQIKIAPRQIQNEEKDADTLKESEEPVKKNLNPKLYATLEELEKEKLPPEEILSLPMFKVGVAEMKVVIERTGGLVILAESFSHSVFKDSFRHVFEDGEQYLGLSFK